MVNPNRWSWSGAPRKPHALEEAVTGNQLLIPPSINSEPSDAVPADKKLQPGAAGVSSRRPSNNRWSWRPNAIISVTLEDQQENDQEGREQDRSEAARPATSSGPRRLSKRNKKLDAAVPTKKPRPSSMIAPASASFGAAPSYSHLQQQQQQQQQHQQAEDQSSSQPSPLPIQPSVGVKDVFNRFLSRRFSKLHTKSSGAQAAEPTPPPSRHQLDQTSSSRPMQAMQSPMRRGPQLHNPQNTLRGASPANPATHTQTLAQGRIDNGRMAAPLPGLDEDTELHLPSPDVLPAAATVAATGVGDSTSPSSIPAPSADDTGILGRLMRRRLAPKDKDTDNKKKPSNAIDSDNADLSATVDRENTSSPDLGSKPNETAGAEMQARSLLLPASHASHKKLNHKTQTKTQPQDGEVVSDSRSPPSSVPRFLRQVAKPQQASASPTQGLGAVTHEPEFWYQSKCHISSQQHMVAPTPATQSTQSKVRTRLSFGKRFWSRSGGNAVGDGDLNNHKIDKPTVAPMVRPVYVPKHAASDFSRTTYPPRQHRLSFSNEQCETSARPLATIPTEAIEDELQFREQRALALMAEKAEKRKSRELLSSAKHDASSPQELHRRLEIVKSSEIEDSATREPGIIDPRPQQHTLLRSNSNVSSGNGKGPARSHSQSRPRSSQRHSFNLVADPYARDLTPPKSVSPVEMEAAFDPPSQPPQVTPEIAPQQTPLPAPEKPKPYKPTHAAHSCRPKTQTDEKPHKDMTDYERFIADAEAVEREYHAQMWRNLAPRSGHYGYTDNAYGSQRPDPVSINPGIANTHQSSRRDSAYYSVNKRASVMSAPGEDERKLMHGQPLGQYGVDNQLGLRHQGSISKRISDYIKPSKPSQDMGQEDWMVSGLANRRSLIAGVAEES